MLKSHIVEQTLNRGILRIGAARSDVSSTVGMRDRVVHDYPAKRPPPCLRSTAPLSYKAGDEQLFEVVGSHAPA